MKKLPLITLVLTIGCFLVSGVYANATSQNVKHAKDHYHPKGKAPTEHTIKILEAAKADLPFEDTRDFDEAKKGFIAGPLSPKIMADAGHVAWDYDAADLTAMGNLTASTSLSSKKRKGRYPNKQRAGTQVIVYH